MNNGFALSEAWQLEFIKKKENWAKLYIEGDILHTWSGIWAKKYLEIK